VKRTTVRKAVAALVAEGKLEPTTVTGRSCRWTFGRGISRRPHPCRQVKPASSLTSGPVRVRLR